MPPRTLRGRTLLPLALASALALVGCAGGSAPESTGADQAAADTTGITDSTVRVAFPTSSGTGVLGAAEGFGIAHGDFLDVLAEGGVTELQTEPVVGVPPVVNALIGEQVELGFLPEANFLTAVANGADLVALDEPIIGLDVWVVGRAGGPSTFAEISGGTLGIFVGDLQERAGRAIVEREGLTDVEYVNSGPGADTLNALIGGTLDAAVVVANDSFAQAVKANGFTIISKLSEDYPDLTVNMVLAAGGGFIERNPGFPELWERARVSAVEAALADPDAYESFMADEFFEGRFGLENREYYTVDNLSVDPFPEGSLDHWDDVLAYLLDGGIAKSEIDYRDFLYSY